MFARVIYGDSKEMIINPNCYIRLIYEYIRIKADVPNEVEIDLCDGKGNLKKINEPPSYKSGLELLELGETYYLVSVRVEKKGRLVPIPLIDSGTALYEILLKKFEANKLPLKNLKSSSNQLGNFGPRRSKQIDTLVVTDVLKKKKKKKELKPVKSTKFPSFVDHEAKSEINFLLPVKDGFKDGRKVVNDVKQSKDSKSNQTLLTARKNIWYLNPSGNCRREKKYIDQGKPTQIKN